MAGESITELLDKLLKRQEELSMESEALENLIATYKKLCAVRHTFVHGSSDQPDLYRGASQRAVQAAQIAEMIEAARRIIIAEKRPMKRGELVKRLEGQGFKVVGTDKNKVFGTNLWRSGKFQSVQGRGYWPIDVELPR